MNVFRTLAAALLLAVAAHAQAPTAPSLPPIDTYIHGAWDTLTRSQTDCKAVVDLKVTTTPVLYLPHGMAVPPAIAAMQSQCHVDVEHLPRTITHMGDVRIADLPREGLLYLPKPYVVPGGRFNEMYGWDSYFIVIGLVRDNRVDLARDMVDDFLFEIENYGAILNANRTYYLTRSQPPLLGPMIDEVYSRTHDKTWLAHAYAIATRDYALWSAAPHLAGNTGLARYSDLASGPVPEMADDSTYYPDVIRWLLAHPGNHPEYLVRSVATPDTRQAAELARTSCDITTSKVCAAAFADGYRLSAGFYHGDRAMRESGFDTSFRFGPFSGSTEDYAPVGLNSLLFRYAQFMSSYASDLGKADDAARWSAAAKSRKTAMNHWLWNAGHGRFEDYDTRTGQLSSYNCITVFYPLWAGLATSAQAASIQKQIPLLEHEGGLAVSDYASGVQWDLPFGWAPTTWFAVYGLQQSGFAADAQRLAGKFNHTVQVNYSNDGTIREKYNVVNGSDNIQLAAGYRANGIGFGWTNGVYLAFQQLFPQLSPAGSAMDLPVTPGPASILGPAELEKLIPPSVFFAGQTATVQLRNAAGVRFGAGSAAPLVLAVKVDTGGYATAIQDRYQDYFLTEAPLLFAGQTLAPGAYGVGFVAGNFTVMDLSGKSVLTIPASTDPTLKRPTPLQVLAQPDGTLRLYSGRSFVQLQPGVLQR